MNAHDAARRILRGTKHWTIQGGVLVPFTSTMPGYSITLWLDRLARPLGCRKVVCVYWNGGDEGYWIFDEDEFVRLGQWCFDHPSIMRRYYRRWQKALRRFNEIIRDLSDNGIRNLHRDFCRFYNAYLLEYAYPLTTEYYNHAGEVLIRELQGQGQSKDLEEDLVTFTKPRTSSFLQREELALLRVVSRLPRHAPRTYSAFRRQVPALAGQLRQIRKEFFWIRMNYRDTVPLTDEDLYHDLLTLRRKPLAELRRRRRALETYERTVARQQRERLRRSTLPRSAIRKLLDVGFAAQWQDDRKAANLQANYWANEFLQAASKEWNVPLADLQFMTPTEFLQILRGGSYRFSELRRRRRIGGLFYLFRSGEEGMLVGRPARRIWQSIASLNHPGAIRELRGLAASPGLVRGRVKKVLSPSLVGKQFKRGDILVTYMTRPDFVPLMHRAAAIVTDEGGLTCHAAIISRELGIPCVVGTRFAVRTLKDGDFIEVNATEGVVRRLNRSSSRT